MLGLLAGKKDALPVARLETRESATEQRRELRRSGKGRMLEKLSSLYREKPRRRDQYQAGEAEGSAGAYQDLTDILFAVQQHGLGRAVVLQESNSHVVFRVESCTCCQVEGHRNGCHYLAGYLAGALKASGRPATTTVTEVSCGQPPGGTCVFMANW